MGEVMRVVERDLVFYEESGGGVTLSGGEPLLQPAFARALLEACRTRGIHTVVETCGMADRNVLLEVAERAGLVLYDLKVLDAEKHRRYTGAPNDRILDNLRVLAISGRPLVVRLPVIPGVNDGAEDLAAYIDLLAQLGLRRVDLLPYHRIGIDKYRRLGRSYRLSETPAPAAERSRALAERFRSEGFEVTIGGMK